jgi:nucleoside-diphosphate-sugar epimerase
VGAPLVLVTGGAGFIGSHLVEALLARGRRVRVLDDLSSGRREFLPDHPELELIVGDVRDAAALQRAVAGTEVVFHQAALRSVPRSVADPWAYHDVNVTGTMRLLLAAREARVRRVVFASSSSVYGDQPVLPLHEDLRPQPIAPYGASKLIGEHYCANFARHYGLETVSLRYFNVFGPRQDPLSEYAAVIARFIQAARRGKPLEIHGDGKQTRDFTYVADIVQGTTAAAEHAPPGSTYNLGGGSRASMLDVLGIIGQEMGDALNVVHEQTQQGDARNTAADISAAERDLEYAPGWTVERGLREQVAWHRARS